MFERRSYGPKFEAMGADAVREALDRGRIAEPEATHARIWLRQLRRARAGLPTDTEDEARTEGSAGGGPMTAPRMPAAGDPHAIARRALATAQRARTIALLALVVAIVGAGVAISVAWASGTPTG